MCPDDRPRERCCSSALTCNTRPGLPVPATIWGSRRPLPLQDWRGSLQWRLAQGLRHRGQPAGSSASGVASRRQHVSMTIDVIEALAGIVAGLLNAERASSAPLRLKRPTTSPRGLRSHRPAILLPGINFGRGAIPPPTRRLPLPGASRYPARYPRKP